ncbi:hypothetical protein KBY28_06745 [Ruegeria pomeroyi]|uniref:hypothetical protein n=1 Tax=Ruegeria pomeroyi TaxID=89184 RepID=UPI001F1A51E7|nr:hypothetical protein [Ruegeria pomeroyi]MCE8508143.1 hypothetical protein [Ruegeria pomeroyi]
MTTNIAKLKALKGTPPKAQGQTDVISNDNRAETMELKPLQVRIPKAVFEEFSECAGKEFGFSHGAKKKLFLKMWEAFKAQNMKA